MRAVKEIEMKCRGWINAVGNVCRRVELDTNQLRLHANVPCGYSHVFTTVLLLTQISDGNILGTDLTDWQARVLQSIQSIVIH